MEDRYMCSDVEARRYGGLESRCRRADVGGMEVWRRAIGVVTWRHGALEARYRCSDV